MLVLAGLTVIDVTFCATVTVQLAECSPSLAQAVMVVVPSETAFTVPLEETVAMEVSPDFHVTVFSVALDGVSVATSVSVPPSIKLMDVLSKVTFETEIKAPETGRMDKP